MEITAEKLTSLRNTMVDLCAYATINGKYSTLDLDKELKLLVWLINHYNQTKDIESVITEGM